MSTLKWIGASPPSGSGRTALLIPQYNESNRTNMHQRLAYFEEVAVSCKTFLDVIIIDDGSTDSSFALIGKFKKNYSSAFYLASVQPNAKKVGALYLATCAIDHDCVILSDFDTDLIHIDRIPEMLSKLNSQDHLMGCYFRMLPNYGSGIVFRFQKFEYSLARSLYKLVEGEGTVPVMPGAGSCYKRDVLLNIYKHHSGNWSGEDRETTLLGLKFGYKTFYRRDIIALTRPPQGFENLVRQRVRWNLGYLETFYKEKKYYCSQIWQGTGIGVRTLIDIFNIILVMIVPLLIIFAFFVGPLAPMWIAGATYLVYIFWGIGLVSIAPKETAELNTWRPLLILTYPPIKICLDFCAWGLAILKFVRSLSAGSLLKKKRMSHTLEDQRLNKVNQYNEIH
jgi:cellulose synthase/poly-beta-1,6-N-acetylglucosamine synthase-like glycosyltransferase